MLSLSGCNCAWRIVATAPGTVQVILFYQFISLVFLITFS